MQLTVDKITALDGVSPMSATYQSVIRSEFLAIIMQSLQALIGTTGDNGFSRVAINSQSIELLPQP